MTGWTKRQREIIDASLEIISAQGIQNLTIKTLSAKISVSEGALYRHFRGKEEILASIAGLFKASTDEILDQVLSIPCSGIKKIKAFFLGRCRQFSKNRGLVLLMFSEDIFKGYESLQKKVLETIHGHKKLLTEAVAAGQKEGALEDIEPEHMFMMVMGALRLLVTRWRGADFGFDLVKEGTKLWHSLEKLISVQCSMFNVQCSIVNRENIPPVRGKEKNDEKTDHSY